MNRISYFTSIASLYMFKSLLDGDGNEFVLLKDSCISTLDWPIFDKTAFEATENHIHLLDHIKQTEFDDLVSAAESIEKSLLYALRHEYPKKHFFVYATITLKDSFIVRFHQKWPDEKPYYDPDEYLNPFEKVLMLEE